MSSIEPTGTTTAPASTAFAAPGSPLREALAAANARFVAAFRAADPAAAAACYTRDAQLLPPNSDAVAGAEAIADYWRGVMALGVADVRLETREVESLGDVAVEVGRYALTGADGGAVDEGKYLVVWHRDAGGAWKLHRDMWTTSRPAAPSGGA